MVHTCGDAIKYFPTYEEAESEGNAKHELFGTHWSVVRVEHIKHI
jgi:hypothetical protein